MDDTANRPSAAPASYLLAVPCRVKEKVGWLLKWIMVL